MSRRAYGFRDQLPGGVALKSGVAVVSWFVSRYVVANRVSSNAKQGDY